jgi:hypothetical protein
MPDLTSKQEKFTQCVAEGMTQADAYRAAYSAGRMKNETIWSKAAILMATTQAGNLADFAAIDFFAKPGDQVFLGAGTEAARPVANDNRFVEMLAAHKIVKRCRAEGDSLAQIIIGSQLHQGIWTRQARAYGTGQILEQIILQPFASGKLTNVVDHVFLIYRSASEEKIGRG